MYEPMARIRKYDGWKSNKDTNKGFSDVYKVRVIWGNPRIGLPDHPMQLSPDRRLGRNVRKKRDGR